MMLRALDRTTGKLVSPGTPDLTGLACPECAGAVFHRQPSTRQAHFVHHNLASSCPGYGPTTAWHLGWQLLAPVDQREVWLPPRRADMVTGSGQVVEIQHSPLAPAIALARTADHYACTGQPVIWILDGAVFRLAVDPARRPLKRSTAPHTGGSVVPSATAWVRPLPPLVQALLHCGQARVWLDVPAKGHALRLGAWWPAAPDRIRTVTYKKLDRKQARTELAADCAARRAA